MRNSFGGKLIFESSDIPEDIMESVIVDTQIIRSNPDLGKALVGIWFDTIRDLFSQDGTGIAARDAVANLSGLSRGMYDVLLEKTHFYRTPQEMLPPMTSRDAISATDTRRKIRFKEGLAGEIADIDDVGIQFESRILGDPNNIKYRFDPRWVRMAANRQL